MPRRNLDRYLTPEWATRALTEHGPTMSGVLLDPCCGDGRMAAALSGFRCRVLNDMAEPGGLDATVPEAWGELVRRCGGAPSGPSWVVTNPPFSHAGPIAWLALQHARRGVALLLRCTFLEPCRSRQWLRDLPPSRVIAMPRISFTGDGRSDSAPTWWFVWERDRLSKTGWRRGDIEVVGRAESAGQLPLEVAGG